MTILADLLEAARAHDVNLSATPTVSREHRLRQHGRDERPAENAGGVEACSRDDDEHGVLGDALRSF